MRTICFFRYFNYTGVCGIVNCYTSYVHFPNAASAFIPHDRDRKVYTAFLVSDVALTWADRNLTRNLSVWQVLSGF